MSFARAYFRIIYIVLGTIIIFGAAMLVVENNYIETMYPILEAKI